MRSATHIPSLTLRFAKWNVLAALLALAVVAAMLVVVIPPLSSQAAYEAMLAGRGIRSVAACAVCPTPPPSLASHWWLVASG